MEFRQSAVGVCTIFCYSLIKNQLFLVHEWTSFRDVNFLRTYGVSAGNFKRNVPAYVGQGVAARGLVPGRIQISQPSGLYYTTNMKAVKLNNQVEFLKKNDDYEYKWVDASPSRCMDGGVMVDDTFYIGRVVIGDYSYLGRIDVGQKGLKYENSNGMEVLTNQYQVLTCFEKSCVTQEGEEKCEDKLDTYEKRITSLNANIREGLSKYSGCERLLNETQDKNILLNRMVTLMGNQAGNCNPDGRGSTQNREARTTLSESCPTSIPDVENVSLKEEMDELRRQAAAATRQNNEQARRITTLETENTRLKRTGQGVEACLRALQSVESLTEDEQTRLMMAISDKISPEDQIKNET